MRFWKLNAFSRSPMSCFSVIEFLASRVSQQSVDLGWLSSNFFGRQIMHCELPWFKNKTNDVHSFHIHLPNEWWQMNCYWLLHTSIVVLIHSFLFPFQWGCTSKGLVNALDSFSCEQLSTSWWEHIIACCLLLVFVVGCC